MRLNLTHLATLQAFVRRGTMAGAAESLGYTPGAVSQHIAALEKALGVPLMVKSGRHVVLTDAGRALASEADVVLAAEERARRSVAESGAGVTGSLVIGTWGSSAAALLAPLLCAVAEQYPGLTLTSREIDVDVAARSVTLGEVDLAFGLDYPDDPLRASATPPSSKLLRERFWVAAPIGNQRSALGPVSMAELADEPWILPDPATVMGRVVRHAFRRAGVEPSIVHEVNDSAASLQLVAQGLGLTLATDLMLHLTGVPRLDRVPLVEDVFRDVVVIAPADLTARPSLQALVSLAAEVVEALRTDSSDSLNSHDDEPSLFIHD